MDEQADNVSCVSHKHEEKTSDPGCCEGSTCGCDGGFISVLLTINPAICMLQIPASTSLLASFAPMMTPIFMPKRAAMIVSGVIIDLNSPD